VIEPAYMVHARQKNPALGDDDAAFMIEQIRLLSIRYEQEADDQPHRQIKKIGKAINHLADALKELEEVRAIDKSDRPEPPLMLAMRSSLAELERARDQMASTVEFRRSVVFEEHVTLARARDIDAPLEHFVVAVSRLWRDHADATLGLGRTERGHSNPFSRFVMAVLAEAKADALTEDRLRNFLRDHALPSMDDDGVIRGGRKRASK